MLSTVTERTRRTGAVPGPTSSCATYRSGRLGPATDRPMIWATFPRLSVWRPSLEKQPSGSARAVRLSANGTGREFMINRTLSETRSRDCCKIRCRVDLLQTKPTQLHSTSLCCRGESFPRRVHAEGRSSSRCSASPGALSSSLAGVLRPDLLGTVTPCDGPENEQRVHSSVLRTEATWSTACTLADWPRQPAVVFGCSGALSTPTSKPTTFEDDCVASPE